MTESLLPTEYVEDGYICEVDYQQSEVLPRLDAMLNEGWKGFIKRMKMISDLTEMANSAVNNVRKSSPAGLVDKSILTRLDQKQMAYGYAVSDYCKKNHPKLFKVLFRKDDVLYNACMAMAICAFDELYRWTDGDEETEPVVLDREEIMAVIAERSVKKGVKL